MTRTIPESLITASQQDVVEPIIMVKLEYDSGNVTVHSRLGDISYNGDTYTGVGDFGTISVVDEESTNTVSSIDLILSGVNSALISTQLTESYQGRDGTVYLGFMDTSTGGLIDAMVLYKGIMNNSEISLGDAGIITVRLTNKIAIWERGAPRRYNSADQQKRFPGDKAFDHVEEIPEQSLMWGRAS